MTGRRVIGFLPFDGDWQVERARRAYRFKIDQVNTTFFTAGRPWSGSHARCLAEAVEEACETLADVAASRGLTVASIRDICLALFDELARDVTYIVTGGPSEAGLIEVAQRELNAGRGRMERLLSGNKALMNEAEIANWIEACGINNSKLAWKQFHAMPNAHGVKKSDFMEQWPSKPRGRPPRK